MKKVTKANKSSKYGRNYGIYYFDTMIHECDRLDTAINNAEWAMREYQIREEVYIVEYATGTAYYF